MKGVLRPPINIDTLIFDKFLERGYFYAVVTYHDKAVLFPNGNKYARRIAVRFGR